MRSTSSASWTGRREGKILFSWQHNPLSLRHKFSPGAQYNVSFFLSKLVGAEHCKLHGGGKCIGNERRQFFLHNANGRRFNFAFEHWEG
jgi:hypothetical protein